MIGLMALFFVVLWVIFSGFVSFLITKKISSDGYKTVVMLILFSILFVAPIVDDILGGVQFRLLCSNDSVAYVNVEKSRNKELFEYSNEAVMSGYILPTKQHEFFFKDKATNEVVVSWRRYESSGGWLSRAINFNSSDAPFTFTGSCRPNYSGMSIVKDLNIKLQSN